MRQSYPIMGEHRKGRRLTAVALAAIMLTGCTAAEHEDGPVAPASVEATKSPAVTESGAGKVACAPEVRVDLRNLSQPASRADELGQLQQVGVEMICAALDDMTDVAAVRRADGLPGVDNGHTYVYGPKPGSGQEEQGPVIELNILDEHLTVTYAGDPGQHRIPPKAVLSMDLTLTSPLVQGKPDRVPGIRDFRELGLPGVAAIDSLQVNTADNAQSVYLADSTRGGVVVSYEPDRLPEGQPLGSDYSVALGTAASVWEDLRS